MIMIFIICDVCGIHELMCKEAGLSFKKECGNEVCESQFLIGHEHSGEYIS